MSEILALGYAYRTEIQCVAPAVRYLAEMQINCHFLLVKDLTKIATEENISHEYVCNIIERGDEKRLLASFDELLENLYDNMASTEDEFPFYLTLPWIKRQVSPQKLLAVANYYLYSKWLIDKERPKRILLPNSCSMFGFVSLCVARERNIDSVVVPDHFVQLSYLCEELLTGCSKYLPENWGVVGESVKRIITGLDVDERSISLVNLPILDSPKPVIELENQSSHLDSVLNKSGCSDFILLTMQDYPEDECVIEDVIKAMELTPTLALIIRPHPASFSQIGLLKKLRIKFTRRVMIEKEACLEILLTRCKMVVALDSLTLYQAILKDKPAVSLAYYSRITTYLFLYSDALISVHSPRHLTNVIWSIVYDQEVQAELKRGRDKLVKNFTLLTDRSSTMQLEDLIKGV